MMKLAVVERDLEVGGEPELTENVVQVLNAEYHANGLQGNNRPFYRVRLLVDMGTYECPYCWTQADVCREHGPCCGECAKEQGRGEKVHRYVEGWS